MSTEGAPLPPPPPTGSAMAGISATPLKELKVKQEPKEDSLLTTEPSSTTPPKPKKPRKDYTAALSALTAVTSTNIEVKEGTWTPRDDLQLKDAVITIGDFDKIHRLVTFSQKFSLEDIKKRWNDLLYDPIIAQVSAAQMAVLPMANKRITTSEYQPQSTFAPQPSSPPKKVQRQDDPIKKIIVESKRKRSHPRHLSQSLVKFLEDETLDILLDEKVRSQVNDKIVELPECPDDIKTCWKREKEIKEQQKKQIQQLILYQQNKQGIHGEKQQVGRKEGTTSSKENLSKAEKTKEYDSLKRTYSVQENASKEAVMKIEKDIEKERERERDPKIIAVIRGFKLRYPMRSKEVIIGRASQGVIVDINILEEINEAPHVSRRQALIKLKHDGNFSIKNIGLCTIFVNGHPLRSGEKCKLNDYYLIEIEQAKFIFEINRLVWNRIKKYIATAKKTQDKQTTTPKGRITVPVPAGSSKLPSQQQHQQNTLQSFPPQQLPLPTSSAPPTSLPPPHLAQGNKIGQLQLPRQLHLNYFGGKGGSNINNNNNNNSGCSSSSTSPALQQPVPQKVESSQNQ